MFVLPIGEYNENFVKGLAAAVSLHLIDPMELDRMFKRKMTHPQIAEAVLKKVKAKIKVMRGKNG